MAGHLAGMESTIRAAVAENLGEARFGLWFGEGVSLGLAGNGESLEVGVPNAFFREWIQSHYAGNLIEAAQTVTGRALRLNFRIDDEAEPKVGHLIEPSGPDERRRGPGISVPLPSSPPPPPTSPPMPPDRQRTQGRPPRRLDDLVTGP